jgi:hypothetical protein
MIRAECLGYTRINEFFLAGECPEDRRLADAGGSRDLCRGDRGAVLGYQWQRVAPGCSWRVGLPYDCANVMITLWAGIRAAIRSAASAIITTGAPMLRW